MDSLIQLTRTPIRFSRDGTEYELSPLRLKDIAEFCVWAKTQIVTQARETIAALGDDAPEEIKRTVWLDAVEQCKHPFSSDASSSPDGILKLCYLSLRIKQPGMTQQQAAILLEPFDLKILSEWIKELLLGKPNSGEGDEKN